MHGASSEKLSIPQNPIYKTPRLHDILSDVPFKASPCKATVFQLKGGKVETGL